LKELFHSVFLKVVGHQQVMVAEWGCLCLLIFLTDPSIHPELHPTPLSSTCSLYLCVLNLYLKKISLLILCIKKAALKFGKSENLLITSSIETFISRKMSKNGSHLSTSGHFILFGRQTVLELGSNFLPFISETFFSLPFLFPPEICHWHQTEEQLKEINEV